MSGTVPDLKGRDPSERAVRYRQKAAHFKDMASTETRPRVRAQLLGLAKEYDELADTGPRKPSVNVLASRAGNDVPGIAVSWGDMRAKPPPGPPGQERDVRVRRR
jgi:hypothetical protein